MQIQRVAVIGAGNMGSGIAQKIAQEGFPVVLVDSTKERAEAGKQRIATLLEEGVKRKIFSADQVQRTLANVTPAGDASAAKDCDLVIEAVFEDLGVKRELFQKLGAVCRKDCILATNTSSFLVADVAQGVLHPERVIGLHYFFHPAKNRLVEVIGHTTSDPQALDAAWAFQLRVGKTPIASKDASGFVVNRFFVPWLNEAIRLHEEGLSIATIETAAKESFGVGMGPFELMNVTGVPITLHAATTLGQHFGAFYAPASSLAPKVKTGAPWDLGGTPDPAKAQQVAERLWGVVFHISAALASEGVGTLEDTDLGAKVGLRWPVGPFEKMNQLGLAKALAWTRALEQRHNLTTPKLLVEQGEKPWTLSRVTLEVKDGVATITINRPDQLNALDPETVRELGVRFHEAEQRSDVRGIVIAGAGKAFVAGADVKFFVDRLRAGGLAQVQRFASEGSKLYREIEKCAKRVVCRMDGLALGGGAELALACHVIVASERASMGFPETGIGIFPGLGGTQRLTKRLGKDLARALIFSGHSLEAKDLAALNLAWRVVPVDQLDASVNAALTEAPVQPKADLAKLPPLFQSWTAGLAGKTLGDLQHADGAGASAELADLLKKISRKAPLALKTCEKLIQLAETADLDHGLAAEQAEIGPAFATQDALEGMSSLLEKRRPTFTGA